MTWQSLPEHIEYFLRLEGKRSSFAYDAQSISKLDKPLSTVKDRLREIKGVGEHTEKMILEILQTKNSSYYDRLSWARACAMSRPICGEGKIRNSSIQKRSSLGTLKKDPVFLLYLHRFEFHVSLLFETSIKWACANLFFVLRRSDFRSLLFMHCSLNLFKFEAANVFCHEDKCFS